MANKLDIRRNSELHKRSKISGTMLHLCNILTMILNSFFYAIVPENNIQHN